MYSKDYTFPSRYSMNGEEFYRDGMSLRDYFAAHALPVAFEAENFGDYHFRRVANAAYNMADEMLKAREL